MSQSNQTELDANEKEIAVARSGSDSPKLSSTPGTDLDVTYDIYKRHAREELDPVEAKRVLRKIDLRILPVGLFRIHSWLRRMLILWALL